MPPDPTLDGFHARISALESKLNKMNQAPTVPIYDSANFPSSAVHGQIVKDLNHDMWVYGEDDTWHKIGGGGGGAAFGQAYLDSGLGDTPQTVPTGTSRNGRFDHVATSDSSIISFDTVVFNNDTASLKQAGIYLINAGSRWAINDPSLSTQIFSSSGAFRPPHLPVVPNTNPSTLDFNSTVQDWVIMHVDAPVVTVRVLHNNLFGSDVNVNVSYLAILYLPLA